MRHSDRVHVSRLAALAYVATAVFALPRVARAEGLKQAPLAGIVRSGSLPVGGIELLVHGLSAPIASFSRIVKTAADGTWVIPSAPAGLYAISSLSSGFRPSVTRVLHRADPSDVSFVTLTLERGSGVLPQTPLGDSDPWIARAITAGDVLREQGSAAIGTTPSIPTPQVAAADLRIPLRASVQSTTGFGATNAATVSATSINLDGIVGSSVRWGLEGQFQRLGGEEGALGNASHLTLDVAPGDQAIRVSARRQSLGAVGDDPARFAAQAIDWSAPMGDRSRASVTARMTSESNLMQRGPVADLFAHATNAFEVEAGYRTESLDGSFVRVAVGYRSAIGMDVPTPILAAMDRETHVGGTAGVQLTRALSVEAGATGDVSNLVRGVMPELTITVATPDGIRIYGFASRRYERRLADELPLSRAGSDDADLSRLSRALYRAGVRWEDQSGGSVSLEASQREMIGTYRLLLDPEFLDNLDSLYFLEGDVAREVTAAGTFRISQGLQGRLSARAGRMAGERATLISRDEARYGAAEAAVRIGYTRTSLGVGYRVVSQELDRSDTILKNELDALDFTLAQSLPIPILRALGSEWRALFSLEVGRRQIGEDEARLNRRFSGGLALSF